MHNQVDPYALAAFIKAAEKKTPVKAYVKGRLEGLQSEHIKFFGTSEAMTLFGESVHVMAWIEEHAASIDDYVIENDRRFSAIPLLDYTKVGARIEPGAMIREGAVIEKEAVIMMGAVINIGAVIGAGAMVDMNAVVGARAIIGKKTHVGAGAVVAGVLEPPSKSPVIIGDDCLIGANAVVLEGVVVGDGAVVAAGAIVTEDVPKGAVVAGSPARVIKMKDAKTAEKTAVLDDLRKLGD